MKFKGNTVTPSGNDPFGEVLEHTLVAARNIKQTFYIEWKDSNNQKIKIPVGHNSSYNVVYKYKDEL